MRVALGAAVFAGTLIALQSVIVGAFGQRLHPFVAALWIHAGGLVFGAVVVLIGRMGLHVHVVRQAPWGLLAGVAGMLLVTGIAVAVAGLGLASALATVTGVQLLIGFGIEVARSPAPLTAATPARLVGALLIVAGVYLVVSRGPAS
ncbi:MAG: DMT family transporter [Nitriliruptoraceae bacterium]